jgi:hypothetical protein
METPRIKIAGLTRWTDNLETDYDWVLQRRDELLTRYGHCIVLVYRQQAIGKGTTLQAALEDAETHLPSESEAVTPVIGVLSPIGSTMNEAIFWELIETTHRDSDGYMDKQVELMTEILSQRSVEDIIEFELLFHQKYGRAYMANLWDAGYVIGCGCSDDGFMDFRSWLIGQGKTVYEAALIDPESLADMLEPRHRDEIMDGRLMTTTWEAYERKTGQEFPYMMLVIGEGQELIGKKDKTRAEAEFPRIVAKLGNCDDWLDALYPNSTPDKD